MKIPDDTTAETPDEKGVTVCPTLATMSPRARLRAIARALKTAQLAALKKEAKASQTHLEAWR
jgi:hypothetical protein